MACVSLAGRGIHFSWSLPDFPRCHLEIDERKCHLFVVRPMRALLLGFCLVLTACMKRTDVDPWPPFTRVEVSQSDSPDQFFPPDAGRERALALKTFMEGQRIGWTRAFAVGFGPPSPVYYAHLHEGGKYVGYFAVGAGVLPGGAAFFQALCGDMFAQKRVTKSEANQFLDAIGVGGELR